MKKVKCCIKIEKVKYKAILFLILCSILIIILLRKQLVDDTPKKVIKLNFTISEFKPRRIIALVFYGRKPSVSILVRYLIKNLKINGGVLEKVIFAIRTNDRQSLEYLGKVLKKYEPYFESVNFNGARTYTEMYEFLHDDDLVFKVDDDVVFISNGTFERMIEEYMTNRLLFLSANVINHALLSFAHARLRAILPFIEKNDYEWVLDGNAGEIDNTVVAKGEYESFSSCWWKNGKCAAVAHESLLYHISNNNLNAYDFKIWDFHSDGYSRWSINFVLMRGKYVNKIGSYFSNSDGDEHIISATIPELIGKHCYALGNAVVSHYSYVSQFNYLSNTAIIKKYDELSKKLLNVQEDVQ